MPLRWVTSAENAIDPTFADALRDQYVALGAAAPVVETSCATPTDDNELLLFHGDQPWVQNAEREAVLTSYASARSTLLPIVEAPEHAPTHLPGALLRFNAFLRNKFTNWPEALVDEVVSVLWQRRRARKIFISYRRIDSEAVARQLYAHYGALGFDVFLDDVEIPRGIDFQAELRRRLDDADAVICLFSPKFMTSTWVREEVALALTHRVGVLAVKWSTLPIEPAELLLIPSDRRIVLSPGPVSANDELTPDHVAAIDQLVFRGRAQSIAGRLRDLVDAARMELVHEFDVPTTATASSRGDLELTESASGTTWLARIVPFRPSTTEVWQWRRQIVATGHAGLVVAYPEFEPGADEACALREICEAWGSHVTPKVWIRGVQP